MLARLSVKKPFYVLVAVIIVLILGGVCLTYMKTNLYPSFQVPYLAVITTDVGAPPEQVEQEVTQVLEDKLGALSGVNNITSQSSENYSLIFLEYADGTDMDSALVKVSAAVNEIKSQLPESAGSPTYTQMSMDMVATMYLGITHENKSASELSQYTNDTIIPALQRVDGIASVTAAGGISDVVEVRLEQSRIDNVNDGILGETNDKLAETNSQLNAAKRQLDNAEEQIDEQQNQLDEAKKAASSGFSQTVGADGALAAQAASIQAQIQVLEASVAQAQTDEQRAGIQAQVEQLTAQLGQVNEQMSQLKNADETKTSTILSLSDAQNKIDEARAQVQEGKDKLEEQKSQYESARDSARTNANIDQLVTKDTISSLIQAQNFEMPAGYASDGASSDRASSNNSNGGNDDGGSASSTKSTDQWMVKIGQKYTSADELRNMVLTNIDGVGDIHLSDVANVIETSANGNSYAKLNGQAGILLSVSKTSTANTGDVSKACKTCIADLQNAEQGLRIITLMDQGSYIDLYISTILKSLLLGAFLAIIVLAVFLRNIKPTLVVAFSIPFSVLFALVIMYFWGLDINIMTLGALSLAIGMLVDNSIVVMENIYRMRASGLSATRAAAQGAMQVTGAIVASTLTSICVFFPFVFTTGTVRQLMVPFALTISFSLLASLIVALSVVPALGSKMFKDSAPKEYKWFLRLKTTYAKSLGFCLRHRALTLAVPAVLFVISIVLVLQMGIVMIPNMTQNDIGVSIKIDNEDLPQEDGYKIADTIGDRVYALDGISEVGVIDNNTGASTMMSGMDSEANIYSGSFLLYALIDEDKIKTESQVIELQNKIYDIAPDLGVTIAKSSESEMSEMTGTDLEIDIKGADNDKVVEISETVIDLVKNTDGCYEVENGQEKADPTLHITFDKDALARMNTTVAQVYQQISSLLSGEKKATTIRSSNNNSSKDIEVRVTDSDIKNTTRQDLLEQEFSDGNGEKHKLSEVASAKEEQGVTTITRENMVYSATVSAKIKDGYNITLLSRDLQPELDKIDLPQGYSVKIAGSFENINDMLRQMLMLAALGFILIYLVMVAQFQSLKGPFIILFTVPLAFTGGLFALVIAHEQLSMMALLGFVILMGTVVNNGIVFVDYVNQMRLQGMSKLAALIMTGTTRMRPIMMTALTTIISMCALIFSTDIGSSMERGMALVVAGGLLYATFMTLYVVPIIYDLFNKKPLREIDVGSDIDTDADDAQKYMELLGEVSRETYVYQPKHRRKKHGEHPSGAADGTGATAGAPAVERSSTKAGEHPSGAAGGVLTAGEHPNDTATGEHPTNKKPSKHTRRNALKAQRKASIKEYEQKIKQAYVDATNTKTPSKEVEHIKTEGKHIKADSEGTKNNE